MLELSRTADASELVQIITTPLEAAFELNKTDLLHIGLIDCNQFSRECLIRAFDGLDPKPAIVPFMTVQKCISDASPSLDLIIYYSHSTNPPERTIVGDITAIRQSFKTARIIILSDSEDAEHPNTIRSALKNGAQGFIPTRTTGIPIAFAAIRFITAGGVFAPPDLFLPKRPERAAEPVQPNRLTPRQLAVLNHLQQGKANKIIAFELGMSESTVKVHVRNIMRKTGATNRTEAAFKAQRLWGNGGLSSFTTASAY
jgi:DNA-binding NarL/FixJ family response regulator